MLWLAGGLAAALLLTRARRQLLTPGPYVAAAAAVLLFLPHVLWQIANGWPTLEAALAEVDEGLAMDRRRLAAIDSDGSLLGWIAAMPDYRGRVWELHPLVVRADARGRGLGRALVRELEDVDR